jgi:hypothetical protein
MVRRGRGLDGAFAEQLGSTGVALTGNKNALKHGAMTADALAFKREIAALARMTRETMAAIEQCGFGAAALVRYRIER